MTYEPTRGTAPYRVIEHLRKQDAGVQLSTAELCEALDIQPSGFASMMSAARAAGAVKAERRPGFGQTFWWSLGDGKPLQKPEDYEEERALHGAVPSPRPGPWLPGLGASAACEPQPFRAAFVSDGQLIIAGGQIIDGAMILTAEQTTKLRALIAWAPA